ncbi:VWA domain-containing protein [Nocardia sp. NPDC058518]|uniref:VWA domain-containing protein n=1 Tax=Nocardia sp. NPDC058518 TaxID=3346534 RepID=UPI00364C3839
MRISVAEAIDAMRCTAEPGVLADRETLCCALRAALVKDQRDDEVFTELFDAYFMLVRLGGGAEQRRDGAAADRAAVDELPSQAGDLTSLTLSGQPAEASGSEGARPEDVRHLFDTENLAPRFSLTEDEGMIDLSAPTDEIAFSQNNQAAEANGYRIQLDAQRLHAGGAPGQLASSDGATVDIRLTPAEQEALLDWLSAADSVEDTSAWENARALGDLPAALHRHAEALLALRHRRATQRRRVTEVAEVSASERSELEDSLRRITRSLRGARTHRRQVGSGGRIDAARTMRRSLRFDGVPFRPVTVRRPEDRPRLVVLADVSLSVRATAHFTLNLVHSLQDMFAHVQSYAFVAGVTETTALFTEYSAERALGEVFGGDVIDLDANSDYGAVFREFFAEHIGALNRRTTLLVLGDGRGNGNDPGLAEFAEIARRSRETIWLTPEPRYSWPLGNCALPAYAEHCDRVRVVRGLRELAHAAHHISAEVAGR